MPEDHSNRDDDAEAIPAKLRAELRRVAQPPVFIPPSVDEAVLRSARRHLERRERPRFRGWPFLGWASGVAALAVLLVLVSRSDRMDGVTDTRTLAQEDLNHDGRVDILDAFALARALRNGAARDFLQDVNGDGLVDERDIAALAARAVSLQKGGRS